MMKKQFINPPELATPRGYTHVVTTQEGKTVYVSGQIAFDVQGKIVGKNDLRRQAEQAFKNLETALSGADATLADIVKVNIYAVNLTPQDMPIIREVRDRYFTQKHLPASTIVGVQALAIEDLLIEIEAIAVVKGG